MDRASTPERYDESDEDALEERFGPELAASARTIWKLRAVYITLAVYLTASITQTLLDSSEAASDRKPTVVVIVLAVSAGKLILLLLAISRVLKEPATWTILIAMVYTLTQLPAAVLGEPFYLGLAFVVILWCFVPIAHKLDRQLRESPELRNCLAVRLRRR